MDGISFILLFGRPILPRVEFNSSYWRVVLGPVAFWVLFRDFEMVMGEYQDLARSVKEKK